MNPSQAANNVFLNNTVAYNGGSHIVSGGGVQCQAGSAFDLYNNIIWGNGASPVNNCTAHSSDLEGGTGTNINADPKFTSLIGNDFTLQGSSPCIDKGADSVPGGVVFPVSDLAGKTRKRDKIPGGPIIDIGAYEVQ